MAEAEIPLEYLALALETTRGTAVTPPTHYLPFAGTLRPVRTKYRPDESRGTLEEWYRSKTIHTSSEWDGEGGADPNYAPLIFNLVAKGGVSAPSTPPSAINTRLWTFTPNILADDIKSATMYFGDPNVQIFQSVYAMADTLTIAADATGEDAATWKIEGRGRYPSKVTAPALPAQNVGDLLMPSAMQLWIDTSLAIGTTAITGRFVKTEWTIPTGVSYKYYANGPSGGLSPTKTGRSKRHAEAMIEVALNDQSILANNEYDQFTNDTLVKMRIRLNGSLIETVTGPLDYYSYIQLDIYGPLDAFEWGSAADTNRTMRFTVQSEYNAAAGCSYLLYAQNAKTSL